MFETVNSFLWFFVPGTALFITGLIFEDKLIEFEDKVKERIANKLRKTN